MFLLLAVVAWQELVTFIVQNQYQASSDLESHKLPLQLCFFKYSYKKNAIPPLTEKRVYLPTWKAKKAYL